MQFATNHLGLSHSARAARFACAAGAARIVSVSSGGHLARRGVRRHRYAFRDYDPFGAYGQSRPPNVLFAVESHRRGPGRHLRQRADARGIAPPLQRTSPRTTPKNRRWRAFGQAGPTSSRRAGAATSVLWRSPLLDGIGGTRAYFGTGAVGQDASRAWRYAAFGPAMATD